MPISTPGGASTKEIWVPTTGYNSGAAWTPLQPGATNETPGARCDAVNSRAHTSFRVPHDYVSIVAAELIVVPAATQAAADWNLNSEYAAIGEAFNTHAEAEAVVTYNVTNGQDFAVDVAIILTALAPGDLVGIGLRVGTAGHSVLVVGLRFRYA